MCPVTSGSPSVAHVVGRDEGQGHQRGRVVAARRSAVAVGALQPGEDDSSAAASTRSRERHPPLARCRPPGTVCGRTSQRAKAAEVDSQYPFCGHPPRSAGRRGPDRGSGTRAPTRRTCAATVPERPREPAGADDVLGWLFHESVAVALAPCELGMGEDRDQEVGDVAVRRVARCQVGHHRIVRCHRIGQIAPEPLTARTWLDVALWVTMSMTCCPELTSCMPRNFWGAVQCCRAWISKAPVLDRRASR